MKIKLQASARGIALIMVLVIIVVLGITAGLFAYRMQVETKLARNASFDGELEWLGRSGIELARYVLAQSAMGPAGQVDSLKAKWAGGPGETNDPSSLIPLDNYQLGAGSVSVKITDLDRKFNINMADEVILRQAFMLIGVDAGSSPAIIDSILDWRDRDDDTHVSGTESATYETLNPPYFAKNGPLDDLTELLLVNGVTPAMYWGSSGAGRPAVLNRPANATQGNRGNFEEPVYSVGLVDLFTALSGRTININTASETALQVIPEIDANFAHDIVTSQRGRAGPDGVDGTEDDTPFRAPGELLQRFPERMGPAGPQGQSFTRFCGVRSLVFEVKVKAQIGGVSREYTALLRRANPRNSEILCFYWR